MSEHVQIEGLAEFRRALRQAGNGATRAMGKALRGAMEPVARRAAGYAPGQIGAGFKPYVRGLNAGIRNRHPGAGVHEWAEGPFQRRSPNGGTHTVNWPARGDAPRYGYRAAEEEMPAVGDACLEAIAGVARGTGWLD